MEEQKSFVEGDTKDQKKEEVADPPTATSTPRQQESFKGPPYTIFDVSCQEQNVLQALRAAKEAIKKHYLHASGKTRVGLLREEYGLANVDLVKLSDRVAGLLSDEGKTFVVFSFGLNEEPSILFFCMTVRKDVKFQMFNPPNNFVSLVCVVSDGPTSYLWNRDRSVKSTASPTDPMPNCIVFFTIKFGKRCLRSTQVDAHVAPQLWYMPVDTRDQLDVIGQLRSLYVKVNGESRQD
jgi:hypothetical protein